jgi:phage terminase small subunit
LRYIYVTSDRIVTMNTKQKLFVDAWLETKDRITSLRAAGYKTCSRVNSNVQFRRLMQSEGVRLAIDKATVGESPVDEAGKRALVAICWAQIKNDELSAKDRSSFASTLTRLEGWDKQVAVVEDLKAPTFANMPFAPKDEPKL